MEFRESRRMKDVQSPMIPIVGEWIAAHPGTISLGQGVVHYPPPAEVSAAVSNATSTDPRLNRYGLVSGIEEYRSLIGDKVTRENGIEISDSNRIVTTAGSNMGFLNAVLAIGDIEDQIILLSPYYFNHEMAIAIAGCRPVVVPTNEEYQISLQAIEDAITDRTRAVVTVSPNNPTGAVYGEAILREVNLLCKEKGIFHIHDEAYEYFVYDGKEHFSPGTIADSSIHTISLFSLSKAYGMAGWRTGYMIIPAQLEVAIKKIQDTNLVCPPIVSQLAGAAALQVGREWCKTQIAGFSDVRNIVLDELSRLGDRCRLPKPEGAFYALIRVDTQRNDADLVEILIRDFGVAVMPGSTFGTGSGCYLRVAYGALNREKVAEGMGRLVKGLDKLVS